MDPHLVYRVTSTLPIPTQGIPTAASINPEGSFIAVGSADGHVIIWCSRSYELFCQTSPLVGECGSTGARVVNMTWVTNELLAFSRRNGLMSVLLVGKRFIEAVSIAVHDHLPVLAMAYSDTLNLWATATHNEINFVQWRPSDWHTFHASPTDRIVAKRVSVSSEEEQPVEVTSLGWIKKSSSVAHLVVSFLHHHVEIIDGETKNVLTHVAIHTPVCRMSLSPDESRALVTNTSGGLTVYDIYSARVIACARDIRGLGEGSPAMFVHGGHAVLVGCEDGQAKLFDATSASRLQSLNHEGGGDVCALTVHTPNNADQFMIITCVVRDMQSTIFVWETVEHGSSHIDNSKDMVWIRILRLTFAWVLLICLVLVRNPV